MALEMTRPGEDAAGMVRSKREGIMMMALNNMIFASMISIQSVGGYEVMRGTLHAADDVILADVQSKMNSRCRDDVNDEKIRGVSVSRGYVGR